MYNIQRSSSYLAPHIKVTTCFLPSSAPSEKLNNAKVADLSKKYPAVSYNPVKDFLKPGNVKLVSGIADCFQIRLAHTDIKVPEEFNQFKKKKTGTHDPYYENSYTKFYSSLASGAAVVSGMIMAKSAVYTVVNYMNVNEVKLAVGRTEVDISSVPEGKTLKVRWRGSPTFVQHRTPKDIKEALETDLSELKDPQHDSERAPDPRYLIVRGVCTHLGCVPIVGAGDYRAFFCPCHGSHYDKSGRIRKGPAPLNLEVPPYKIEGGMLIIG